MAGCDKQALSLYLCSSDLKTCTEQVSRCARFTLSASSGKLDAARNCAGHHSKGIASVKGVEVFVSSRAVLHEGYERPYALRHRLQIDRRNIWVSKSGSSGGSG